MVNLFEKISELTSKHLDLVLVTVTEKSGMAPLEIGKKMLVSESGEFFGTIGGGLIEFYALNKCKEIILNRQSLSEKYIIDDGDVKPLEDEKVLPMACGGKTTLFYEFIGPKQYIYLIGSGHCSLNIAKLLKPLGFYVISIDPRDEFLSLTKDNVNEIIKDNYSNYILKNNIRNNAYFVIGTPSHKTDFEALDTIIEKNVNPHYIGMICSRKKIIDYINHAHEKFGKDIDLSYLFAPCGINIGGNMPEEVALSIVSEIVGIYHKKNNYPLHMRDNCELKYWKK